MLLGLPVDTEYGQVTKHSHAAMTSFSRREHIPVRIAPVRCKCKMNDEDEVRELLR